MLSFEGFLAKYTQNKKTYLHVRKKKSLKRKYVLKNWAINNKNALIENI